MATILPNIPRFYTGIAEWLACMLLIFRLKPSKRRINHLAIIALGIGQIFLQIIVGFWPLWYWVFGMLVNLLWMFLTLYWSEKVNLSVKLYHLSKAFILAEFWASLSWQLYCYLLLQLKLPQWNELIFMFSCYVLLFITFFKLEKKTKYQYALLNIKKREVISAIVTASMVFMISNLGFALTNTFLNLGDSVTIFMMRTFIDLCGILLLKLQENQRYESFLKGDLTAINNMFQSQYEQYQAYRESSQLVNQRFHDLKHQLDVLALEDDADKRKIYLSQLRKGITQYRSAVKTGNAIADVILTRKNTYCIQNKITFTCIADGALLNMIETMDLCSLLGNALDNAIESSLKIADTEKRLINLRIAQKANFILFSLENYIEAPPSFEGGLPKTTKSDQQQHGYGLKSIDYIANKYNGSLTVGVKDNWFSIKVLLPLT